MGIFSEQTLSHVAAQENVVNIQTTSTPLVAQSSKRFGLIFTAGTTNAYTVTTIKGQVFGIGMRIPTTIAPVFLTYDRFGALVQMAWYAAASGGNQVVSVIELYSVDEGIDYGPQIPIPITPPASWLPAFGVNQ